MKLGQQGQSTTYNISDLSLKANAVAQIALGHSHAVNKNIEVGGKLKFLSVRGVVVFITVNLYTESVKLTAYHTAYLIVIFA